MNEKLNCYGDAIKYNLLINYIRVNKGYSIRKVSLKSGVARGYISDLCNGKYHNPSLDVLIKLTKAFNCTLNDLIIVKEENKR